MPTMPIEFPALQSLSFWLFAVLSVGAALGVVFHRNIIYSTLFLITTFLSIAAFFVMLNADFLAIAQIIIYGVGLTIILLFGVMLTGKEFFKPEVVPLKRRVWMGIAALSVFIILMCCLVSPNLTLNSIVLPFTPEIQNPQTIAMLKEVGTAPALGNLLFNGNQPGATYTLPFEIASVLLLVAMMGAILLAKRSFSGETSVEKTGVSLNDPKSQTEREKLHV